MNCDGCGNEIEIAAEVSPKFDTFTDLVYGVCCAASVRAFYDARDRLHTEVSDRFTAGRLELREKWKADHPNGKLP